MRIWCGRPVSMSISTTVPAGLEPSTRTLVRAARAPSSCEAPCTVPSRGCATGPIGVSTENIILDGVPLHESTVHALNRAFPPRASQRSGAQLSSARKGPGQTFRGPTCAWESRLDRARGPERAGYFRGIRLPARWEARGASPRPADPCLGRGGRNSEGLRALPTVGGPS